MTQTTISAIRERIGPILRRYQIEQAILFGSYARGEPTQHSDIDLMLVKETSERFLERTRGLLEEIAAEFPDHDVEVLVYTPDELASMSHRPFIRTVLEEGIRLHEPTQATA